MNENENNFAALRRLLALKRHEVPPPGYFDRFSGEVLARIRAGDTGGLDDWAERLPWLFRFLQTLEAKPAFAGALASALCLLLVAGIVYAERPDATMTQPFVLPTAGASSLNVAAMPSLSASPVLASSLISSTNPVFNPQPVGGSMLPVRLFGDPNSSVQPVSFNLSGN